MKSNPWQKDPSLPVFEHDPYGVLHRLFLNQTATSSSAEGILRELGFVHVFTASGIHLYAFLSFMEWMGLKFSQFTRWNETGIKSVFRALALLILIKLWMLQGFRVGFLRPLITFVLRQIALHWGLKWRVLYPLLITLALDFIFQMESMGRAHYYLAVGGGLVTLEWMKRLRKKHPQFPQASEIAREHGMMAFGSWFATAVVDLLLHHQIAWMTAFYSLVTIPVISAFLYPVTALVLIFFPPGLPSMEQAWNEFINAMLWFSRHELTFSLVSCRAIEIAGTLTMGGAFFFYWVKDSKKRSLFTALILFVVVVSKIAAPFVFEDSLIAQLDVKQGDGFLVHWARDQGSRTEMIDVGGAHAWNEAEWMQKLSALDVNEIDSVLLSHLDEDHWGALTNLLLIVKIHCVQTHAELLQGTRGIKLQEKLSALDPSLQFSSSGCMQIPETKWFRSTESREDGNGLMAGNFVDLGNSHGYFALGDGDESQELQYWNDFHSEIEKTQFKIWKVGHHGSKYSSSPEFLKKFQANQYLISVGKHNPYHHPHFETLERLQKSSQDGNAKIYRTDEGGDWVEKINQFPFWSSN